MFKFFTKEIIKPFPVPSYIMFNVDNFNTWFNAPDNGATYAHVGIFLRTDKLSLNHVTEYMEKCYGISEWKNNHVPDTVWAFYEEVRADWIKKLSEK